MSFEIAKIEDAGDGQQVQALAERLASVIEKAEKLSADWSENHDTLRV